MGKPSKYVDGLQSTMEQYELVKKGHFETAKKVDKLQALIKQVPRILLVQ